ncbi:MULTISPECIES: peptidylprolyl isomerase [unclassified Xanthobacter]|uniref:peptidylprolyl isomerase n=1 Tax=unclassified Xanthobacter TaxID=2623496 RepID=UPI001EDD2CA1|nr:MULTISPECIES: peptidylprolyl isomerase [unclassified Xanthobacter]
MRIPLRLAPLLTLALALLLPLFAPGTALAQKVVVMVNGDPITSYDVTQRQRLVQLLDRKSISPKQALEQLIDDRLKIQQVRYLKTTIDQKDADRLFASVAERSGRTAQQLAAGLSQGGLDPEAFKTKLAADYVWGQYVRSRAGSVTIRDADVIAALQKRGETSLTATEYVLRPIIFVVPRNSNGHGARLAEANSVRARFNGCESGLEMLKGLREVVVRPPALRLSSDMPPALQKIFDQTAVGRLTPPEVSQSGVETFAVCEKRQVRGESPQKREIKDELSSKQFNSVSSKLLAELRKGALIQYR